MNRLPPTDSELRDRRVKWSLFALAALLMAAVLVVGHEAGKRACRAERAEAERAQANAVRALREANEMADLAEATAAAVWGRDSTIHALPACRPRVRVVATDGGMEP